MKLLAITLLSYCLAAAVSPASQPAERHDVALFTTAESTGDRLARSTGRPLKSSVQPLETETCVFVATAPWLRSS